MTSTVKLSKADARRAMVRHHFNPDATIMGAFERLRSIRFDPIAPVGCNHDLVLQSHVPGYKIGDWEKFAYQDRLIYDGWDKQASLVPMEGWPLRRIIHKVHRQWFEKKIFEDYKEVVEVILKEMTDRGPLLPKEFSFQQRREEWKVSWHGPSVTKQTLRALWHSGLIMTAGRKSGQHIYDLTERILPSHLYNQPLLDDKEAIRQLVLERHEVTGIVKPTAGPEMWCYQVLSSGRKEAIASLLADEELVPIDIEGIKANTTPEFLSLLDQPSLEPRVIFIAPLDKFLWDRKLIAQLFGFDYIWEIYVPEAKRKWGYYVLPILFGDSLVARAEFYCRDGILELREWHQEAGSLGSTFYTELERALRDFMIYCSATSIKFSPGIDTKISALARIL